MTDDHKIYQDHNLDRFTCKLLLYTAEAESSHDADLIANAPADLEHLLTALGVAVEALQFYADRENWDDDNACPTIWDDGSIDLGNRAKAALQKIEGMK